MQHEETGGISLGLKIQDAAKMLGIHRSAIDAAIVNGELEIVKLRPGIRRIPEKSLKAWIASKTVREKRML